MSFKTDFIEAIANILSEQEKTANGTQIAKALDTLGIRTKCGKKYKGKRGIYKIVRDAYNAAEARNDMQTAEKIARTITLTNGIVAWQKKYPQTQAQGCQTAITSTDNQNP